ncbi:MAG: hypothetical protein RIQ71_2597, partial [Verrucomicrobiota bacterium]
MPFSQTTVYRGNAPFPASKIAVPASPFLRRSFAIFALAVVFALAPSSAIAQTTFYWFGASTTFSTNVNWDSAANGAGTNPLAASLLNGTLNLILQSAGTSQPLDMRTNMSILSLTVTATNQSSIGCRVNQLSQPLTLGSGGITVASGSGGLLLGIGVNANAQTNLPVVLAANQTWSNATILSVVDNITNSSFTLTVDGAGLTTLGGTNSTNSQIGVISGAGGLTKIGTGTLLLFGPNTYGGVTTIGGGVLRVTNVADTGTASGIGTNGTIIITNGGIFDYAGAASDTMNRTINLAAGDGVISVSNLSVALTNTGVISNTGSLVKSGAGTLILGRTNTYTGGTTINAGTLAISNGASFGSNNVTFASNGTTVLARASMQVTNDYALNGNGTMDVGAFILTNSGVISGVGNLTKAGAGTMVLSGSNSFTGATTITNGVLNVRNSNGLGTKAGGVTVGSGAALELQGGVSIGAEALALSGTGISSGGALRSISGDNIYGGTITNVTASRVNSDAGTLALSGAINANALALTFGGAGNIAANGAITNSASTVTKDGAGTLTLAASNTYSGGTTINAGTVAISNAFAFGSNTVTFASNGTTVLALANLQVTNNYALTTNGTMDVGAFILTNTGVISGGGSL